MTKEGLEQFEEVLDKRTQNAFRNRKVPVDYEAARKTNPIWENIIKPGLNNNYINEETELTLFTPSIVSYLEDLKEYEKVQNGA